MTASSSSRAATADPTSGVVHTSYPVQPVPFSNVKLDDVFWRPRIETNRTVTVPHAFAKCDVRIANLRRAAKLEEGHFQGCPFDDSDVYKVMEGAAYCLATHPDPALAKQLDELVDTVARAQEPDGYLYSARTIEGEKAPGRASNVRWLNELGGVNGVDSHELYNMGHMIEAAVAHYQATGSRTFLNVAIKAADLIDRTWGPGPDQLKIAPGHQEIELALVKLGRATGNQKYIQLARFLLDCRGHYRRPTGVDVEMNDRYFANEVPVGQLTEAVGHAVRTAYMLCGMTDIAALMGAKDFAKAADAIWDDTIQTKLYLHGGIGSGVGTAEGFGEAFQLPNKGYNETCAAIGNCLWNHRLFLLHDDGKYLDVLERALYNNVLAGISLSGDRFFYPNPLVSTGGYARVSWFGCPCCPGNLARFIPSVPGLMYAVRGDRCYVALYAAGTGTIDLGGTNVTLVQKTRYPWDGASAITVGVDAPREFELKLRIPGWAVGKPVPGNLYHYLDPTSNTPTVKVNGKKVPVRIVQGFTSIRRQWTAGDTVELSLPMPVRRVLANKKVKDDQGLVALERGPVVYCVEGIDHGGQVDNMYIEDTARLKPEARPDMLGGVTVLSGKARRLDGKSAHLTAIPYYAWCNRGAGTMAVWLPRTAGAVKPDANLYREPLRGQFHFSARRGWLNDPNGLVFFNGEYHLFFQHNPNDVNWGPMHWGHAVSKDLVHWEELPIALAPDTLGPLFSGSAVVDWHNTSGLGSKAKPALVLIYTAAGTPAVQCIASTTDGRTFVKFPGNPVVKQITPGNRDPKVFWHEPTKKWVMTLYVEVNKVHTIHFLTSPNLKDWTETSKIDGFYECPDMFELPVDGDASRKKWVLTAANSEYMVGTFDGTTFTPETPQLPGHRGKGFYAAQTFSDIPAKDGRRIQIGWFQTETKGMPFNQSMSIPLELNLVGTAEGPRLTWTPVKELESLRAKTHAIAPMTLKPGSTNPLAGVKTELVELRTEFTPDDASEVVFTVRGATIAYDTKKQELVINGHHASAPLRNGRQRLVIYCDRTGVEVCASDGLTYVPMPFIPKADDLALSVQASSGTARITGLEVHALKTAWESSGR